MYRCLETCLLSLKNHPERENFIVLIHPFITEIVSGVHDYSRNIKEKKKIYNENSQVKFDWSTFDSFYPEEINKEFFYLNFVNNFSSLEEKIKVENMIMRIKENHENFSQVDEMLVEFTNYFESLNKRPETLKSMFERNLKFKDYLKNNFILENDEKVLVFTHSAFTKISTSKIAYNMQEIDDYPKDSYRPENCEMITIYL